MLLRTSPAGDFAAPSCFNLIMSFYIVPHPQIAKPSLPQRAVLYFLRFLFALPERIGCDASDFLLVFVVFYSFLLIL